jgi:hypothetical protein
LADGEFGELRDDLANAESVYFSTSNLKTTFECRSEGHEHGTY